MEAALKQLISSNANFTGGAVFTAQGRVLATTLTIDKDEIEAMVNTFSDEDTAYANGLTLKSERYELHRYYPDNEPSLAYGRKEPQTLENGILYGEGIALAKNSNDIYALITFDYPCTSTRAVPVLVEFSKTLSM